MAIYNTVAYYEAKLTKVDEAIDRILLIGQETSNNSGGSSTDMKDVELDKLEKYRDKLIDKINALNRGSKSFRLKGAW